MTFYRLRTIRLWSRNCCFFRCKRVKMLKYLYWRFLG